jgi:hypothetical protein
MPSVFRFTTENPPAAAASVSVPACAHTGVQMEVNAMDAAKTLASVLFRFMYALPNNVLSADLPARQFTNYLFSGAEQSFYCASNVN